MFKCVKSKSIIQKSRDFEKLKEFHRIIFPENDTHHGYVLYAKRKTWFHEGKKFSAVPLIHYEDINNFSNGNFKFDFGGRVDYYMTSNTMCSFDANNQNTFSFHSLVIDIDLHEVCPCTDRDFIMDVLNETAEKICNTLGKEEKYPLPNVIVLTGCGLQLWYAIEQMSYKMEVSYLRFGYYITDMLLKKILNDDPLEAEFKHERLCVLMIDKVSHCGYSGFFRVPFSYNSKAECYGDMVILHENRIYVPDFLKKYGEKERKPKKNIFGVRPSEDGTIQPNYEQFNQLRRNALFALLKLRLSSGKWGKIGYRNNIIFALYNSVVHTYGHARAMEEVMEMNKLFPVPFTEYEIMSTLCSSIRKQYKLKNEKLIAFLQLTLEEIKACAFPCKERRKSLREWRIPEEVKAKVVELGKQGMTRKEISEMLGVTVKSVGVIFNENNIKSLKQQATIKAKELLMEGLPVSEILVQTGLSRSYVFGIKKKMKEDLLLPNMTSEEKKAVREAKKAKEEQEKAEQKEIKEQERQKKAEEKAAKEEAARKKDEKIQKYVVDMYEQGSEIKEIIRHLKIYEGLSVSHNKVIQILAANELIPISHWNWIVKKKENRKRIIELMDEGLKVDEIAERLSLNQKVVSRIYRDVQRKRTVQKTKARIKHREKEGFVFRYAYAD